MQFYRKAKIDKPLVCGILFFMKYPNLKVGDRLNYLLVVNIDSEINCRGRLKRTVYCKCDCGNDTSFPIYKPKESCGCMKGNFKYGDYNKKSYSSWRAMQVRCNENAAEKYPNWAGRGIVICKGLLSFVTFQKILGDPPSKEHSVDRWPDNENGNYSCGNCDECKDKKWPLNVRWGTKKQQAENTRNCYKVELDGEVITLKEACRRKGLPYKQVHERIKRGGWDINIAINTPVIHGTTIRYKKLINNDKISTT